MSYQARVLGLSDEYQALGRWFVASGGSDFPAYLSSDFVSLGTSTPAPVASFAFGHSDDLPDNISPDSFLANMTLSFLLQFRRTLIRSSAACSLLL